MIPLFAIKAATARLFDLEPSEIDGRDRTARVSHPRHVAMTLARDLTDYSYPELGRQFGGRDHTCVMRGVSRVRHMEQCRPEVRECLRRIRAALKADHMPIFKSSRATQRSAET